MYITFNELRRVKHALPSGSMILIAERLSISEDAVRNYFGGTHYKSGESAGIHVQQGPDGGIVALEDTTIWEMANTILAEKGLA